MLFIAAVYMMAAGSFAYEGKYAWAVIATCWGIGNALLGMMSR